jgi:hypothetical protein
MRKSEFHLDKTSLRDRSTVQKGGLSVKKKKITRYGDFYQDLLGRTVYLGDVGSKAT